MNILVTAGNTLVLVDKVRCLTNIFSGRTGAAIALAAYERGHAVTLVTSHPERVAELPGAPATFDESRWQLFRYHTFEDLDILMEKHIRGVKLDAVVHSAAVSDYLSAGVYAARQGTSFDPTTNRWQGAPPSLIDRRAGKVKSDEPELWLRLTRAPKLVDKIRRDWGFTGKLVKFKLEVGLADEQLLAVAENSRRQSEADLMVANTLEGAAAYAFIGPPYVRVSRRDLPARLMETLQTPVA